MAESSGFAFLAETLPRLKSVQVSILTTHSRISLRQEGIFSCNDSAPTNHEPAILSTDGDITPPTSGSTFNLNLSQLDLSSFSDAKIVQGVLGLRFKTKISAVITLPRDCLDDCDDTLPFKLVFACSFCGQQLTKYEEGY